MPKRQPRTARRQPDREAPTRRERETNGAELPDIVEEPLQPWLEPIGNTGLYQSPVEPVDPRDCDRWPDSPYCGGSGVNIQDFMDLGFEPHANECEICVTVAPTLAYISLPPYTICYRKDSPNCRPQPQIEAVPPAEIVQSAEFDISQQCFCSVYKVSYTLHLGGVAFGSSIRCLSPVYGVFIKEGHHQTCWDVDEQPDFIDELYNARTLVVKSKHTYYYALTKQTCADPRNLLECEVFDVLEGFSDARIEYDADFDRGWTQKQGTWFRCELDPGGPTRTTPPPPAPPYFPASNSQEPCCMNCAEQDRLLRLIAKRLGTDDYPASVPKSLLTDRGTGQQKIESLTQLIGWFVQQVDGLVGEFPINIDIEDTDPTKPGNQSQKVKIPNIAEAIADLYALSLKNSVDSDAAISFLMRLASEVIGIKNAALITQDYARANAEFLGYKGDNVKRDVSYAFDPEGLASLETILKESNKQIIGWQIDETDSLLDYQKRLMFAAGIIKAVFFRGQKDVPQLNREVNNLVNSNQDEDRDERWREFLRAINNPSHRFNVGDSPNPDIKDLSVPTDLSQLKVEEDKK